MNIYLAIFFVLALSTMFCVILYPLLKQDITHRMQAEFDVKEKKLRDKEKRLEDMEDYLQRYRWEVDARNSEALEECEQSKNL